MSGDGIDALTTTLKPRSAGIPDLGNLPYRISQITSTAGLANQPPTVTIDGAEAAIAGSPWEYQPFDTVAWLPGPGSPLIIARIPCVGSSTLMVDDIDDDPEPWHVVGDPGEPAFQNSWTNYGGVYMTARFRKQSDGWVKLQGLLKGVSGGTTIFTLPPDFAPDRNYCFTNSSTQSGYCDLFVNTDGTVQHGSDGTIATDMSISDIFFPTKVNRAALYHPKMESQWQSNSASSRETITTYLRSDGWCWWTGIARRTDYSGTAEFILARIDSDLALNPFAQIIGVMTTSGNCGRLNIGGSNAGSLRSPTGITWENPGSTLVQAIVLGGMNYWTECAANVPWINATYLNGWRFNGGDFTDAQYYLDQHGMVHLRGLLTGASKTANTAFNLPAGYRPSANLIFKAVRGAEIQSRVEVQAGGDVILSNPSTSYFSIAGICFFAEQ